MANTLLMNSGNAVEGLGTQTYTIVNAGITQVGIQTTLPLGSGVQIVINQNGSPLFTIGGAANDPTVTQPSIGGSVSFQAAAGDSLTVVLTSANAVDKIPNAVKSTITLFQGF